MKIALVRKNYTPYGGAENYLRLVFKGLQAQGNEVQIFSANEWGADISNVHKIRTVKKPSFLSNLFFAFNIQSAFKKEFFDCILSFERIPFQDIPHVRKTPPVMLSNGVYRAGDGCHKEWLERRRAVEPFYKGLSFSINPHHLVMLYLEKKCFENSGVIIANSMMVKNDIIRHYRILEDKICVIYNGVDRNRFRPVTAEQKNIARDSLGIKEHSIILFAGADLKRKGLKTLLKAFSLLKMKDKRLIVAGKRPSLKYIELAERLKINKSVTFWGAETSLEHLYTVSDVFVLPTIYDPFSNASLEAMASGLPVVTTVYNGVSELISDGAEGFAIKDPFDEKVFADKISLALAQSVEMGEKARAKAEGYSIDRAIGEIIRLIETQRGGFDR
ncbi:MAG: glycosyltransferase family 4 protein [Nitrospirae bacterium]|nr:glycosyltransferase family 4 protein [Nitrospirota bacterium]